MDTEKKKYLGMSPTPPALSAFAAAILGQPLALVVFTCALILAQAQGHAVQMREYFTKYTTCSPSGDSLNI